MAEVIDNRKNLGTLTPMMEQYLQIKEQYEGYVLFYRLGDFYECFFDDAIIASKALDLTLTGRDCGEGRRAAMCGVPFHKSDLYVGKLVEQGYKVAICEQTENPQNAEGKLVKREVVRVVTPGTVTDNGLLNDGKNNYLSAICLTESGISLSTADISTGDIYTTYLSGDDAIPRLENELGAFQPSEIILNVDKGACADLTKFIYDRVGSLINDNQKRLFTYEKNRELVKNVFKNEVDKLVAPEMYMSVGALLNYINETQMSEITYTKELNVYSRGQYLELDYGTRRNLELTESMRAKEKKGSLLWVLDRTNTAMGARLLRSWLLKPLLNPVEISNRQSAVKDFYDNPRIRDEIRDLISDTLDIERLTAKTVYGTANARDLRAIFVSIQNLPKIKDTILKSGCKRLIDIVSKLDTLEDISDILSKAIVDNPPLTIREGGMIRDGYDADIDYYRNIRDGSANILSQIEQREKDDTGIKLLKIGYNRVFGYYIEVTRSNLESVPDRYIRKQTLSNCERFITQELKEIESSILNADEKVVTLEYDMFCKLRDFISANNSRIRTAAGLIAEIDVFNSLAEVASKNNYVCPEVDLSSDLFIKDGRHPVVERFVKDSYFVPNDTHLDTSSNRVMIITGPNMAGKSTYMRQVAIITIMAQIGSYVPAREAKIGVVDKVFTRVGASDDLASGQSTFMLEMSEVATILKNATKKSLIIYDEVGRGTSTFDGMSIARAVVEYTHSKKIGAKTLFATHYHELTDMEGEFDGIVNYNIAAKKRSDSIIFLRKIVRGGTDDSYGIEVAKLAGVPNEVVKRAKEILEKTESGLSIEKRETKKSDYLAGEVDMFSSIMASKDSEVAEKIRALDINTVTPIEAMNFLFELKRMLEY